MITQLSTLDWSLIIAFFIISTLIGIWASRTAGKSTTEFFLSGRNMSWWLLGISMVATTFSADTPNLVTDIVRKDGVAGNWAWWAYLVTGMVTVFVYARLWRRSNVLTDIEFYELRYSGESAAFLRGFRAFYLGVIFNVLVMAAVCLAAIKIGGTLLGLSPMQTILISSVVTVIYSSLGGLKGIIFTDVFQFILAMIGSVWAAYVIINLPEVGGLSDLLVHENVAGKLDLLPAFDNSETMWTLLIIPLAVQWWASYYPGAEPGGGGYIAQRMLAAKDERNSMGATLLFNIAHYALRPWPWILIALASLIVFPDLESLAKAFPHMDKNIVQHDLAYPAMLTYLPSGLLGLVVASLIAAFMSTISTQLNLGSSYITNDLYKRFIKPESSERELVNVGRITTVLMMILAAFVALRLENAKEIFDIIVLMGAGSGAIFIIRWFWWRINAYSEITAMIVSFFVAVYLKYMLVDVDGESILKGHEQFLWTVGITTAAWLIATFATRPTDQNVLTNFYKKIKPAKVGWKPVINKAIINNELKQSDTVTGQLPLEILCVLVGCFTVYAALFATGYWLYGETTLAIVNTIIAILGTVFIMKFWGQLKSDEK